MAKTFRARIAGLILVNVGGLFAGENAISQSVTEKNGRSYQIVEIERILDSGFPSALFSYGKPTVFNGVRVVTVGWLYANCNIVGEDSNMLRPVTYRFGEGSLPLYWGNVPAAEYMKAEADCKKYAASKHIDWPNMLGALYLFYGEVRNGGTSPYSVCFTSEIFPHKDTIGCNHMDVEHVEFQEAFETSSQFFGDVAVDIGRYVGPELIKHLILKGN